MRTLLYLVILLTTISCGFKPLYSTLMGNTMLIVTDDIYNDLQLDSMCTVDSLPHNLKHWDSITTKDFEGNEYVIIHYTYRYTDSTDVLYKIEKLSDDAYKIIKRQTLK